MHLTGIMTRGNWLGGYRQVGTRKEIERMQAVKRELYFGCNTTWWCVLHLVASYCACLVAFHFILVRSCWFDSFDRFSWRLSLISSRVGHLTSGRKFWFGENGEQSNQPKSSDLVRVRGSLRRVVHKVCTTNLSVTLIGEFKNSLKFCLSVSFHAAFSRPLLIKTPESELFNNTNFKHKTSIL